MKKIIFGAFALLISFHSFAWSSFPSFAWRGPDVQQLLEQSIEKSFPNAEHVTWSNDADGYTVSFTVKSILTRISYDKKGNFTGSLRNYSGELLPLFISNLLKQKYPKDQIYGVTEMASPTALNYFVKLEGPRNWITVQVDSEGNNMVVEKYRKQE
jgi:hypothetical protein